METNDAGKEEMERNNWASQNSQRVVELRKKKNRRNPQSNTNPKSSWTPKILKLLILRYHKTWIWFVYSKTRRQINTLRLTDTNTDTDTDNRTVLRINSLIRVFVTAADVLRSWTVPRLGVLPERELSGFVPDLSALEDWNDAWMYVLGDGDGDCDGDRYKKQVCLEQRGGVR